MSAKDKFHNVVKSALVQDGWTITHDPFPIDYGDVQMQIDLGSERLVAAERGDEKIAVEVKSFIDPSTISEFHTALGQCLNYRSALRAKEQIYMAYKVSFVIEKDEYGYYAYCPELPRCQSQGDSLEEVQANIKEAVELYIETLSESEKQEL